MPTRKLRALLVHDEEFSHVDSWSLFDTNDVDVYPMFPGRRLPYIRSYDDVINVLRRPLEKEKPPPDLLLVDCAFQDDRWPDPPPTVDPRGLLFGSVLVARYLGADPVLPIGCAVYSQDLAGAVSEDRYANAFYGLLRVQTWGKEEGKEEEDWSADAMKRCMQNDPAGQGGKPSHVVQVAIERYRYRLKASIGLGLEVDAQTAEQAKDAINRHINGENAPREDLALEWWNAQLGYGDSVLVTSLFADCRRSTEGGRHRTWDKEVLQKKNVVTWLHDIAGRNYMGEIFRPAMESMHDADVEMVASVGERRAAIFLVNWARNRYQHRSNPTVGMKTATHLGYWHSKQMGRALRELFGLDDRDPAGKPSEVVRLLDAAERWPYPRRIWIRRCLQECLSGDPEFRETCHWPECLRD